MKGSSRRAMTLIEVLAATVLLAILGSVCASVLRSVPVIPTDPASGTVSVDMLSLERAVDELLGDPDLREHVIADASVETSMPWPDEPAQPAIQVRRVEHESAAEESEHAWVAFSCEQCIVWRCIELPKDKQTP